MLFSDGVCGLVMVCGCGLVIVCMGVVQVPDRGGRPRETRPPPEMPSFRKRTEAPQDQRSHSGRGGGRGGGKGGRVQGGWSKGGGGGKKGEGRGGNKGGGGWSQQASHDGAYQGYQGNQSDKKYHS